MPQLITNGTYPHDTDAVLAVMLWPAPEDEERRRQYCAAQEAHRLLKAGDDPLCISAALLSTLLDTQDWPSLIKDVVARTKRATVAGQVLAAMYVMELNADILPPTGADGASMSKAYHIVMEWARSGMTFGDGDSMPRLSDKTLKKYLAEFAPVAHFWAAKDLLKPFNVPERGALFGPDGLPILLEAASYLQSFGLAYVPSNKSKAARTRLLDKTSIWLLDQSVHRPRIPVADERDLYANAPFREYLRSYSG
jgi:hypothetical protein